jgi:microcystin-dependent protein
LIFKYLYLLHPLFIAHTLARNKTNKLITLKQFIMDGVIGTIMMFAGNFAPRTWAFCDGQLLPINQYTALFSILGTTYGGDGRNTFALPDLRGRVSVHPGSGPGLSTYRLGQKGGAEQNNLTNAQLPAIPLKVSTGNATQTAATAGVSIATPGSTSGRTFAATEGFNTSTPDVALNPASIGGGNSAPVNNVQPYGCVNYVICLNGIYPSRS